MFPLPPVKCPNPLDYPDSYNSNTKKEELVLEYVDNFKKQFQYIYPDRRPLFLTPINECAMEKFVCTTIRPTTLQFSEIYDWEKCARFTSEYLQFQPLKSATDYVRLHSFSNTSYANIIPLNLASGIMVTDKGVKRPKRKLF